MDESKFQSFGRTSETHPAFYPFRGNAEAFVWEVAEVNGHDGGAVHAVARQRKDQKLFMLFGNTV